MISPSAVGRDVRVLLATEEEFFAEIYAVTDTVARVGLWGTSSRSRSIKLDEIVAVEFVSLPQREVVRIAQRQRDVYERGKFSAFRVAHQATASEATAKKKARAR